MQKHTMQWKSKPQINAFSAQFHCIFIYIEGNAHATSGFWMQSFKRLGYIYDFKNFILQGDAKFIKSDSKYVTQYV